MFDTEQRVLVVDDDPIVARVFVRFLKKQGFKATIAQDGEQGLALFDQQKPDLVLTDLRMPKVNGLEVVKDIARRSPRTPVIVVSGTHDLKEMIDAMRFGAWDYLVKPVEDHEILTMAVEKCLDKARLMKENDRFRLNLEEQVLSRTRAFQHELTERKKTEVLLGKSLKSLQSMVHEIIDAISKIGDIRDPYTGDHQTRVAELSRRIAVKLGLDEEDILGVYFAGMVHDIGKMCVPLEILSKPGKISELEMDMIKTHTVVGHNILMGIHFPWQIADMVHQHHERMDGSGYPAGLSSDEILPGAKIIAVADVVEAISSHRPYRPALGIKFALEEITSGSGSRYNPEAVSACVSLVEDGFAFA